MGRRSFKYDKVICRKFGKKIASLRDANNLKQDETAFRAGISTSYLSAIERGVTDITLSTIKRLAKVFGLDIRELFSFDKK